MMGMVVLALVLVLVLALYSQVVESIVILINPMFFHLLEFEHKLDHQEKFVDLMMMTVLLIQEELMAVLE